MSTKLKLSTPARKEKSESESKSESETKKEEFKIVESCYQNSISYKNINVSKIIFGKPQDQKAEEIKPDGTKEVVNYKTISINYDYAKPDDDVPSIGTFVIDYPQVKAPKGVEIEKKKGVDVATVLIKFDGKNPEHKILMDKLEEVHQVAAVHCEQYKGLLGMPKFQSSDADGRGFKKIVYQPIDKETCEIVEGAQHSMFLKFTKGTKISLPTPETEENITIIPKEKLQEVDMNIIPQVAFSHIYNGGGKLSIQHRCRGFIFLSGEKIDAKVAQKCTVHELGKNAELVNKAMHDFDKLSEPTGIKPSYSVKESTEIDTSKGTFSGLEEKSESPTKKSESKIDFD